MRGSSSFLLIHVMTDRFSDPLVVDQEGTSSTSTKWDPSSSAASSACALFGGRSLTAHLGELLAGGGQVRPPVDEGPGRPGGRREGGREGEQDPSAGSSGTPRGRAPVIETDQAHPCTWTRRQNWPPPEFS